MKKERTVIKIRRKELKLRDESFIADKLKYPLKIRENKKKYNRKKLNKNLED